MTFDEMFVEDLTFEYGELGRGWSKKTIRISKKIGWFFLLKTL
jgi:hypothetical protein